MIPNCLLKRSRYSRFAIDFCVSLWSVTQQLSLTFLWCCQIAVKYKLYSVLIKRFLPPKKNHYFIQEQSTNECGQDLKQVHIASPLLPLPPAPRFLPSLSCSCQCPFLTRCVLTLANGFRGSSFTAKFCQAR